MSSKRKASGDLFDILLTQLKEPHLIQIIEEMDDPPIFLRSASIAETTTMLQMTYDKEEHVCSYICDHTLQMLKYADLTAKQRALHDPSNGDFLRVLGTQQRTYGGFKYTHYESMEFIKLMFDHNSNQEREIRPLELPDNCDSCFGVTETQLIGCSRCLQTQRLFLCTFCYVTNSWHAECHFQQEYTNKQKGTLQGITGNEDWLVVTQRTAVIIFNRKTETHNVILFGAACRCIAKEFPVIWDNMLYLFVLGKTNVAFLTLNLETHAWSKHGEHLCHSLQTTPTRAKNILIY